MTQADLFGAGAGARVGAPASTPEFPHVPPELLEALERVFPDRCPDSELSDADIRERIGECRVVRFIKRHFLRQQRALQGKVL